MGKKQVLKVKYGKQELYGISLNADNSLLLLENKKLFDMQDRTLSEIYFGFGFGRTGLTINGSSLRDTEVTISATRNVNPELREILERNGDALNKAIDLQCKIDKLVEDMRPLDGTMRTMEADIRSAKGLLSREEFAKAFEEALPEQLRRAMSPSACKGRDYNHEYTGYTVEAIESWYSTNEFTLEVRRDVDVEKYFRKASFVYEEYDGTIFLHDKADKDPEYQKYVQKYSSPLPVKQKPKEGLSVGNDKDYLRYHCVYEIEVNKPLTKEYAAELAKKFAGAEKTKKKTTQVER